MGQQETTTRTSNRDLGGTLGKMDEGMAKNVECVIADYASNVMKGFFLSFNKFYQVLVE